jgi:hypothetical protein
MRVLLCFNSLGNKIEFTLSGEIKPQAVGRFGRCGVKRRQTAGHDRIYNGFTYGASARQTISPPAQQTNKRSQAAAKPW